MKKQPMRVCGFNLIEITMAIAVVGIGIAGILALFPPAIEANKTADNQNYLGGVSETVMAFLETQILSDFSKVSAISKTVRPVIAAKKTTETWTAVPNFPGLYVITADAVYGVQSADGSVSAYISIWAPSAKVPGMPDEATDVNSRRVFVEVNWPATLPDAQRQKRLYVYDVFKNN